ncbi:MAG: hypothetical protein KBD73_03320 [Candidatus Magasanikbacteria bacterium]|nr:hypothetical protein [Candidatus Magasanikbacteria bacterium]
MGEKDTGNFTFEETTDLIRRREEPTQIDFKQPEKTMVMRDETGIGRQIFDAGFSVDPLDQQKIIDMCKNESTGGIDTEKFAEILSRAKQAKERMDMVFDLCFSSFRGIDTHDFVILDNVLSYCKSIGLFSDSPPNGPVIFATSEITKPLIINGKKEKVSISYGIDILSDFTDPKYRIFLPQFFPVNVL